jgi:hypothetical protein
MAYQTSGIGPQQLGSRAAGPGGSAGSAGSSCGALADSKQSLLPEHPVLAE